ncbi:rRNA adenine N-6-methyltransferase family protein [Candidatus Vidania fulgoroideorum]
MYKKCERFLINNNILLKIFSELSFNNFIELGGGYGNISDLILKKTKNFFLIFEKNKKFFKYLKKKYKNFKNVFLLNKDFLKFKNINYKFFRINFFSSLPFNITSKVLNKLLKLNKFFNNIYLILQKEYFIKKINNKKKFFYYLFYIFFNIKKFFFIEGINYFPKVKVETVFLSIKVKHIFNKKFCAFVIKKIKYIFYYKSTKFFVRREKITIKEFLIFSLYLFNKSFKKKYFF